MTEPTSGKFRSALLALLLLGVALGVLGLYYYSQTRVQGVEFNPNTWEARRFDFRADPFTNYQWTDIRHSSALTISPAIMAHIQIGLDPAASRWDLGTISDYRRSNSPGPASAIIELLKQAPFFGGATSTEFWSDWTINNPKQSAKFWRSAQILTIHDAYNSMTELFELPMLNNSNFEEQLNQLTAHALLKRALQYLQTGQPLQARAAASAGLKYSPNNSELQQIAVGDKN